MVSQVVAIFLLLLAHRFPALRPLGLVSLWLVVALALVSGVDYFQRFWRDVLRSTPRPAGETRTAESGPVREGG
jgi:phosphatidylglycerophosphate synthase